MVARLHGDFTKELYEYLHGRLPNETASFVNDTAYHIVLMSRMGLAPEAADTPSNLESVVTDGLARAAEFKPSGFRFGAASEKEFEGVDLRLVQCAVKALTYSSQDFCCYDGIRSYKEQQQYVANGTSKTMESKHLRGLAVDLVPWINGKPTWDWEGCYLIAFAMDRAATELGIANIITWGGAWDRRLSDFGGDAREYEKVVQEYRKRHPGKDFIDGPHFEIRL